MRQQQKVSKLSVVALGMFAETIQVVAELRSSAALCQTAISIFVQYVSSLGLGPTVPFSWSAS